ncbi:MAG: hypothetical protein R3C03_14690 [Pirellulaceae bacterium]
MPNWYPSKITNKKVWTEGLYTLRVDAAGVEPFEPGQFLHLAIEKGDQILNRPYSVASPHGPEIEFYIVEVEAGQLTPNFRDIQVGDPVLVSQKAAGSFTLSKTPSSNCIWLIATGTGIAPYIAMLRSTEIWERYKRIVLVHGAGSFVIWVTWKNFANCKRKTKAVSFTSQRSLANRIHVPYKDD